MNKLDHKKPSFKSNACDYCHEKKIRCDKRKPQCYECVKRSINCNYGTRLKRGPKREENKIFNRTKRIDQIQNIPKSSPHLQAMLFELEFNKKMAEFWRIILSKIGEGALRPPPKFAPGTEEFIRTPGAALTLMEDFDSTHRLIYTMHNFALSTDIAVKLWQIVVDVHAADFISSISTFETSLLVSMIEYLVVFQLGTKIRLHDDMAAYIMNIIHYVINIVVYARSGTSDSLTPELTLQLLPSITLIARYFKLTLNKEATTAYHSLIQDLYEQNKASPLFKKEVEARMLCRKMFTCPTKESSNQCLQRLDELDKEGIMTPNLNFHHYNHLAFYVLRHRGQLSEASTAIQKAEYFIKWHFDTIPQDKRPAVEDYFTTRLSCVHIEILLRLGLVEAAHQRVSQMYSAFARLPATFRHMCSAKFKFLVNSTSCKEEFLSVGYLALAFNPMSTINRVPFPSLAQSTVKQGSTCAPVHTTNGVGEQFDTVDSSNSSSPIDLVLLSAFSLNTSDESPDLTLMLESTDQFFFDNAELEPLTFVDYHNV